MKKLLTSIKSLVLLASLSVGMVACIDSEKTFPKDGFTIAQWQFCRKTHVSHTALFESRIIIVSVVRESFAYLENVGISSNISLRQYAELIIQANASSDTSVEEKNGFACFESERKVEGKDFSYFAVVLCGSDAFQLVQFACETKNYDKNPDIFINWAKTINVD